MKMASRLSLRASNREGSLARSKSGLNPIPFVSIIYICQHSKEKWDG